MSRILGSTFGLTDESVNLLLPFGFLALSAAELTLLRPLSLVGFILALSTLAAAHHMFSLSLLLTVLEIKAWIDTKTNGKPFLFWVPFGLIFAVLLVVFGASFKKLKIDNQLLSFLLVSFYFLDSVLFSSFHMIYQSMGVSFIHSNKVIQASSEPEGTRNRLKWYLEIERNLVRMLLFSVVLSTIVFRGYLDGYEHFLAYAMYYKTIAVVFSLCVSAGLIFVGYRCFKLGLPIKLIFSIRYLVWPFYAFSMAAVSGVRIIHGYEYFLVWKKIKRSRQERVVMYSSIFVIGITTLYFFLLLFRKNGMADYFLSMGSGPKSDFIIWSWSIYAATNILHIIIDSMIFKMRDKSVRKASMKLLLNSN
ncbi:MAG: hypothetical protein IPL83_06890 [Bdellovibrionales bacterium]|nr:hypothetical protein [Bdellovibrionales bacterium]